MKILFGALVTIYFKIEKNLRKQKSSALMRSIWSVTSDLVSRAQKLVFTSVYYIADIGEAWFSLGPFLVS